MPSTIFTLLKQDHRDVSKLFAQICKLELSDVTQKQELFMQLKSSLDIHAKVEEALLYTPLRLAEPTHMTILESIEEHHLLEKCLLDLSVFPMNTDEWTAKLTVLKELVEHHVEEEENELFKQAQEVLGRKDLIEIGQRFEVEKKKLMNSVMIMV